MKIYTSSCSGMQFIHYRLETRQFLRWIN